MNKGQAFTTDFITSIVLFSVVLLGFVLSWNFVLNQQVGLMDQDEMAQRADATVKSLVNHPGRPGDWSSEELEYIGLSEEPNVVNSEKVKDLREEDSLDARSALKASNFYLTVDEYTDEIILEGNDFSTGNSNGSKAFEDLKIGYPGHEGSEDLNFLVLYRFNEDGNIEDYIGRNHIDASPGDFDRQRDVRGILDSQAALVQNPNDEQTEVVELELTHSPETFTFWVNEGDGWEHHFGDLEENDVWVNGSKNDWENYYFNYEEEDMELSIGNGPEGNFEGKMANFALLSNRASVENMNATRFNFENGEYRGDYSREFNLREPEELNEVTVNIDMRPSHSVSLTVGNENSEEDIQDLEPGVNEEHLTLDSGEEYFVEVEGSTEDINDSWRVESMRLNFEDQVTWRSLTAGEEPFSSELVMPASREITLRGENRENRARLVYRLWE